MLSTNILQLELMWRSISASFNNITVEWIVIVCELKYSVRGAVLPLPFIAAAPIGLNYLILVGLACKFRYSGFSGFSVALPSEWVKPAWNRVFYTFRWSKLQQHGSEWTLLHRLCRVNKRCLDIDYDDKMFYYIFFFCLKPHSHSKPSLVPFPFHLGSTGRTGSHPETGGSVSGSSWPVFLDKTLKPCSSAAVQQQFQNIFF